MKTILAREINRWKQSIATLKSGRGGPDAVHHLRTHSRRCREGFRVLGYKDEALAHFSRSLSPARDLEMLWQHLAAERHPTPEYRRLQDVFNRRRKALRRKLIQQLRSPTLKQLTGRLQEILQKLSISRADEEDLARTALRKAYRRIHRLWKKRPQRPDGPYLHHLRRAIRRLRYVAELTTPVSGRRLEKIAQRASQWQRLLGDYQDSLIAQKLLRLVRQPLAQRLRREFQGMERKTSKRFWKKWRHGGWHKLQRKARKLIK